MCVCVCVCIYIYIYIYICVCVCVCVRIMFISRSTKRPRRRNISYRSIHCKNGANWYSDNEISAADSENTLPLWTSPEQAVGWSGEEWGEEKNAWFFFFWNYVESLNVVYKIYANNSSYTRHFPCKCFTIINTQPVFLFDSYDRWNQFEIHREREREREREIERERKRERDWKINRLRLVDIDLTDSHIYR